MAIETALAGKNAAEELIRFTTVQAEGKADLKNCVPLDGLLQSKPFPYFPRRIHVGLRKRGADEGNLGINVRSIPLIAVFRNELSYSGRERPKEPHQLEQLFHEVIIFPENCSQRFLKNRAICRHGLSPQSFDHPY